MNSSVYVFAADALWEGLANLDTDNAQGELYLTDAVRHLVDDGRAGRRVPCGGPPCRRRREHQGRSGDGRSAAPRPDHRGHLEAGVTVVDPATTWIEPDVEIEPDAVIQPFTVLRGRTLVRRGAAVGPHAVVVDATIGEGALVGPFCYLRPGTVLAAGAKAGTFVELKNARIGEGTKVPHLSYLGDADVGDGANVGAGNITANYRARAGPREGPHDDRPERQDRDSQWVRGSRDDRRRRMDWRRLVHHRGRSARVARDRTGQTGHQGGLPAWKAERLSSRFQASA